MDQPIFTLQMYLATEMVPHYVFGVCEDIVIILNLLHRPPQHILSFLCTILGSCTWKVEPVFFVNILF